MYVRRLKTNIYPLKKFLSFEQNLAKNTTFTNYRLILASIIEKN